MIYRFINEAISPTLIKSIQDNNFSNDVEWKEIYKKLVLDWDDVVANYADTIKALDKAVAEGKKPEDNRNLRTKIKDLALKKVGYDPKEIGTREQRKQEETLNKTLDVIRSVDPFNARIAYLTAVLRAFFEHIGKKNYKKYEEDAYNLFYREQMQNGGFDPTKDDYGNTFFNILAKIPVTTLDKLKIEQLKLIVDVIKKGLISKDSFDLRLGGKSIFSNGRILSDIFTRDNRDMQYTLHVINLLTDRTALSKYIKDIPSEQDLRSILFKSDRSLRDAGKDGDKYYDSLDDKDKNTIYAGIEHLSQSNEKEQIADTNNYITYKEFLEKNKLRTTARDLYLFLQNARMETKSEKFYKELIELLEPYFEKETSAPIGEKNTEFEQRFNKLINSTDELIPEVDDKNLQIQGILKLFSKYK